MTLGSDLSRIQEDVLDIVFALAKHAGIVWFAKRIPGRRLKQWAQEREDKAS